MVARATLTLKQRLESLPQELYDEIHDYTFAAVQAEIVNIDHSYKPPAVMQVDRNTRATYIAHHTKCTFVGREYYLKAWLCLQKGKARSYPDLRCWMVQKAEEIDGLTDWELGRCNRPEIWIIGRLPSRWTEVLVKTFLYESQAIDDDPDMSTMKESHEPIWI